MEGKPTGAGPVKRPIPLVKQTLSDQIYHRLKEDIIAQRIHFGEKLVNRDLQIKFGVSSTPVRDAINHLYLDGLLENITNGGARVINFDVHFALEVNEVISVLTRGAVEAASRAGRLAELAERQAPLVEAQWNVRDLNEYIALDMQFHQIFFECSNNAHLTRTYSQYTVLYEMLVRCSKTQVAERSTSMRQHQKMYECCLAGDAEGMKQEIKSHYDVVADWFRQNATSFMR